MFKAVHYITPFILASLALVQGFAFQRGSSHPFLSRTNQNVISPSRALKDSNAETLTTIQEDDTDQIEQPLRASMKFIGPYPCVGLHFPDLATSSQRARNVTGIELDFLLDTAANKNIINGQVAKELDLSIIGETRGGVGAAGSLGMGNDYLLGTCELEDFRNVTFMEGLTASAVPVANPAAPGILSLAFFSCFEDGVEFSWGSKEALPSITFLLPGEAESTTTSMSAVPLTEISETRLLTVQMSINNITIPALLDTGSPITVLNSQAAELAGVDIVEFGKRTVEKSRNPFVNMATRFKEAKAMADAASRGDALLIAGSDGKMVSLFKSKTPADIGIPNESSSLVEFGQSDVYVGNLPGLAALKGLGDDSPPAAILGMDVLRRRPRMLLLARDKKAYF